VFSPLDINFVVANPPHRFLPKGFQVAIVGFSERADITNGHESKDRAEKSPTAIVT
jgi:hypothetical protein